MPRVRMLVGGRARARRVCPSTFVSERSGKMEVGSESLGVGMVKGQKKSIW